jgi:hypothetical protein
MKESRIRGLTAEELEAVVGGTKNGWVTSTTTWDGPDHKGGTTTTSLPYGQFKKT